MSQFNLLNFCYLILILLANKKNIVVVWSKKKGNHWKSVKRRYRWELTGVNYTTFFVPFICNMWDLTTVFAFNLCGRVKNFYDLFEQRKKSLQKFYCFISFALSTSVFVCSLPNCRCINSPLIRSNFFFPFNPVYS